MACPGNLMRWDFRPDELEGRAEELMKNAKDVFDRVANVKHDAVTYENSLKVCLAVITCHVDCSMTGQPVYPSLDLEKVLFISKQGNFINWATEIKLCETISYGIDAFIMVSNLLIIK